MPSSSRPASRSFGRQDKAAADAEMLALGLEATTLYGLGRAGNPHRRCRAVYRFRRRARSGAGVEAAPGQGLQQKMVAGARSRPDRRSPPPTARRNIRACSRRWPAPIPRPRIISSPICSRSPASPRSAAARSAEIADRFLEQAALGAGTRLPRETRALIERFLAVRGDPDEAAAELRALAADAKISLGARARSVRDPHRLSRRPRRRRARHQIRHRFRPRLRLLHRLRIRAARARAAAKRALVAGGRYDDLLTRLGAREAIPAVGFAASIDWQARRAMRRRRMSAPLILAVPSKGRLQQNAEALFRALRARARQAARRARLSRHHRRLRRRRNRLSLGGRDHLAARARRRASRRHRRGSGARDDPRRRPSASCSSSRSASASPMSSSPCRRPGSTCAAWPTSTTSPPRSALKHERKMRLATKYANLTRDFFADARRRRLPHRRKLRRHRRRAGGRHRRNDRRHHHDRRDARRQRPQGDRGRRDPALAGEPRRRAHRGLGRRAARNRAAPARPHRRAKARRMPIAKCAPASPA